MTEINIFNIYMSYKGAAPAAIKGEIEEYLKEEFLDSVADDSTLNVEISSSIKDNDEPDRLFIEIKCPNDQEARIAFMAWLAENPLWEVSMLTAIAMHSNERFDLITESYKYNYCRHQLIVSHMNQDMLDWAVTQCDGYESLEAKQAAADMTWQSLGRAHKLEELVVALRRKHAS